MVDIKEVSCGLAHSNGKQFDHQKSAVTSGTRLAGLSRAV